MSSRREKEKRLRPRNSPYKRDYFDQSRFLRIPVSESLAGSRDDTEIAAESADNEINKD